MTGSARQALTVGLRWLYDTPQPKGAILQHHGEMLPAHDGERAYRFVPAGWEGRAVIVVEVARPRYEHDNPANPLANPIGETELADLTKLLAELSAPVVHTWNGHPFASGSLALERPAHPTLLAAVNLYRAGCPDHPDQSVFCNCDWYQQGHQKIVQPTRKNNPMNQPSPALAKETDTTHSAPTRSEPVPEADDQVRLKRLDIVGGAVHAELVPPESFAAAFIETARASLGSAESYMEYELSDNETGERFAVRVQRVGKLTPHQARQEVEAERDGLLATLQHVQATLDRWIRPHSTAHAHDCMYAVAELQRLLNPHRKEPDV